jgi:hypothetical protein
VLLSVDDENNALDVAGHPGRLVAYCAGFGWEPPAPRRLNVATPRDRKHWTCRQRERDNATNIVIVARLRILIVIVALFISF